MGVLAAGRAGDERDQVSVVLQTQRRQVAGVDGAGVRHPICQRLAQHLDEEDVALSELVEPGEIVGLEPSLEQLQLKIGSEARFEVATDVPTLADGTYWEYFRIVDQIDSNLQDPGVRNVRLDGDADALVEGTDYTIVRVGGDAVNNTGGQVMIHFTRAGLDKLQAAAPAQVTAEFYAKVFSIPADGQIVNTAFPSSNTLTPDPEDPDPEEPGEPEEPEEPVDPPTDPETPVTPEVYTNWGDIKGLKFTEDDEDNKVNLAGAEFAIYAATTPYPAAGGACTAAYDTTGTPVDTATSTAAGLVHFQGLYVSQGDEDDPGSTTRCYVLVETKAPAGYTLNATPRAVTVVQGLTDISNFVYDFEFENVQQPVPGLPLTGGVGQVALGLGGGGLLVLTLLVMAGRRARAARL